MILNPEVVGTNGNIFSYTGHVYEESTGLYYAKARYYDAKIGRFISEDGYRGERSESVSLNLYVYVQNNPVKYSDPSGNIAIPLLYPAAVIILVVGTYAISTYERYIHSPEGKDAINRGATAIKDGVIVAGKLQAAGTVWLGKKYVEYNLKFVDKAKDIISSLFGIKPKTSPNYFTLSNIDQTTFILQSKGAYQPQSKAKEKDKAVSVSKSRSGSNVIYRLGSGNGTNLTPRQVNVTGLSYTTIKPLGVSYTVTTIDAINATGKLIAIKDAPTHVSVVPLNMATMKEWIASRPMANTSPHEYTRILQGISTRVK